MIYIYNEEEAFEILLSLTETTSSRLRKSGNLCKLVAVSIKTNSFISYSHQKKLIVPTDSTNIIFNNIKTAFKESWNGEPIRHLGVSPLSGGNGEEDYLFMSSIL